MTDSTSVLPISACNALRQVTSLQETLTPKKLSKISPKEKNELRRIFDKIAFSSGLASQLLNYDAISGDNNQSNS